MALLPIRIYPDPVLREECPEVEVFDDALRNLVDDMVATMYAAPGVGLAAPQVGERMRVVVVDVSVGEEEGELLVLVNPEIVEQVGTEVEVEGCLSIPGFTEKVERADRIRVRAQDLAGEPFELETDGWEARAILHEVDHLDGVLFVDRLRGLKKERARRFLRKLREEQEVPA
ncbi:MAG: peptide deformylase [Thermoanaerobaculia bacterium]|nr:peptide deformylase [Thermoanaerobaculia bacterium]